MGPSTGARGMVSILCPSYVLLSYESVLCQEFDVGREIGGLEFEIARSSTGDDAASAAYFSCFLTLTTTADGGHQGPARSSPSVPLGHGDQ